jgi:hypothetical protein
MGVVNVCEMKSLRVGNEIPLRLADSENGDYQYG